MAANGVSVILGEARLSLRAFVSWSLILAGGSRLIGRQVWFYDLQAKERKEGKKEWGKWIRFSVASCDLSNGMVSLQRKDESNEDQMELVAIGTTFLHWGDNEPDASNPEEPLQLVPDPPIGIKEALTSCPKQKDVNVRRAVARTLWRHLIPSVSEMEAEAVAEEEEEEEEEEEAVRGEDQSRSPSTSPPLEDNPGQDQEESPHPNHQEESPHPNNHQVPGISYVNTEQQEKVPLASYGHSEPPPARKAQDMSSFRPRDILSNPPNPPPALGTPPAQPPLVPVSSLLIQPQPQPQPQPQSDLVEKEMQTRVKAISEARKRKRSKSATPPVEKSKEQVDFWLACDFCKKWRMVTKEQHDSFADRNFFCPLKGNGTDCRDPEDAHSEDEEGKDEEGKCDGGKGQRKRRKRSKRKNYRPKFGGLSVPPPPPPMIFQLVPPPPPPMIYQLVPPPPPMISQLGPHPQAMKGVPRRVIEETHLQLKPPPLDKGVAPLTAPLTALFCNHVPPPPSMQDKDLIILLSDVAKAVGLEATCSRIVQGLATEAESNISLSERLEAIAIREGKLFEWARIRKVMGLVCSRFQIIIQEQNLSHRKSLASLKWRLLMREIQSSFEAARKMDFEQSSHIPSAKHVNLLHQAIDAAAVATQITASSATSSPLTFSSFLLNIHHVSLSTDVSLIEHILARGRDERELERLKAALSPPV